MNRVILEIARTHLLSRRRQSVIAALGVTFGIGVFIAMVGFMTGVNKFLEELMLANTAHVRIYRDHTRAEHTLLDRDRKGLNRVSGIRSVESKQNLKNGSEILRLIRQDHRVEGASPLLIAQVFYNSGGNPVNGTVSGVDILEYDKLFDLKNKMDHGHITQLLSVSNGLIMGSGLAGRLNLSLSDQVLVTTHIGVQLRLRVVGIFSTGIAAIDDVSSFASLNTAQRVLGRNSDYFTDIHVRLAQINDSRTMAQLWQQQFRYRADDWKTANAEVLVGFTLRNTITIAVSIALLVVAAFGIYNILTMMIYEKMNDIAILKATGFRGGDITKIFLTEALIIGLAGGLAGLLLGYLLSLGIASIPLQSAQLKTLSHLPVNFEAGYYIQGLLFALLTTFLAGWLPARKAANIDPIEIIRGK